MTVERDDYGDFHVRGTYDDGEPGWRHQGLAEGVRSRWTRRPSIPRAKW